jgi:hypothetical protein
VPGEELRAQARVLRGEDPGHLGERYVQLAEAVDHLSGRDLLARAVVVPAVRVDRGGLDESGLVVAVEACGR